MRYRKYGLLILMLVTSCFAGDSWPQFRGPFGNGHSDCPDTPLHWSETENIRWKTAIHDRGWSTPVVLDGQVWLTTATVDGHKFYALCVDLNTGKIIYDILLFTEEKPQSINEMNSYATPSPVIEKGRVYVHFGTFGTVCIDTNTGKKLWERRDLHCNHLQGPASSPIIYKNLLILHLEGTDVQYVCALDKMTGATVWKSNRPGDVYNDDVLPLYKKAYSTPIIIVVNGKPQLISEGAQATFALDPDTGKEIWRVVYGFDSTIACPVSDGGLVFVNTGWDNHDIGLWAVKPDSKGDVTKSHVVWKYNERVCGESSPVIVDGLLYMVADMGFITCLEAATGKLVWKERLSGKFGAAPVYAGGLLYFSNKQGHSFVIKPGKEFNLAAENKLDAPIWASPAVIGKSLLLRTETHLYRIEKN
ncbi:MAG TPA: PQQ-binding-like beta-propeller repeat protein [bacterium]|nr:PQQ-binding-like beta-propeller repeat protein [bacterium]HPN43413.1 PQQ-binding-like beta-propeller repeat protein [bacterium]